MVSADDHRAPQMLDLFVTVHACTAFLFATCMLAFPAAFSAFSREEITNDSLTGDSIRWASPFVFGFALLAGSSLRMGAAERRAIAGIFAAAFWMALLVGLWVHANGRWTQWHAANLVLFGSLAAAYTSFLVGCRGAFESSSRKRRHS